MALVKSIGVFFCDFFPLLFALSEKKNVPHSKTQTIPGQFFPRLCMAHFKINSLNYLKFVLIMGLKVKLLVSYV